MNAAAFFGFLAAALILFSTAPPLVKAIRHPPAKGSAAAEIFGRAIQLAGNACWVVVGALTANTPLTFAAVVNCFLLAALIARLAQKA